MKPKTLDELWKEKGFGSGNEAVVRLEDVRAMLERRIDEFEGWVGEAIVDELRRIIGKEKKT